MNERIKQVWEQAAKTPEEKKLQDKAVNDGQ